MDKIISSSIVSFGIVLASVIYYNAPRPGRYVCKFESTMQSASYTCTDTASGVEYTVLIDLKSSDSNLIVTDHKTGKMKSSKIKINPK